MSISRWGVYLIWCQDLPVSKVRDQTCSREWDLVSRCTGWEVWLLWVQNIQLGPIEGKYPTIPEIKSRSTVSCSRLSSEARWLQTHKLIGNDLDLWSDLDIDPRLTLTQSKINDKHRWHRFKMPQVNFDLQPLQQNILFTSLTLKFHLKLFQLS